MSIKAVIATQFDPTGLNKAIGQFNKLGSSIKGALGAVGLSVSLASIVSGLQDASKAAISDAKSQAILASSLRNVAGASDEAIAAVEDQISKMSMASGIVDDQLRPAFQNLVTATGSVTKAQSLMGLAMDVAADKQISVETASKMLGKAVNGTTKQLFAMYPNLKNSSNWMEQLAINTAGATQAAANSDPLTRINTIFGEMQEAIGTALIPSLQDFASWLSSPDTQNALKFMIDGFNGWVAAMKNTVDGANAVGQALANVLNIDPNIAGQAWNGFFNGLGRSIANLVGGPFGSVLLKLFNLLGGGAKVEPVSFTPTTFTPTDFDIVGTSGSKTSGTTKKTKAQIAAEKAQAAYDKAIADLKKFQTELTGMGGFAGLTSMAKDLGEFQQSVVDTFDEINKKIAEGLANKTISTKGLDKLRSFLKAQQALLEENARQRDALIEKRSLAKTLISDVKGALTGFGNLSNLVSNETRKVTTSVNKIVNGTSLAVRKTVEETIGASGYLDRLKKIVTNTKTFATQLTQLKSLGLNKDLFKQIVEAGPDVGGQLATEILAGGADSVTALNDTFKELETVSAQVAEQTAVVMYNNGVEVVGGLVEGLLSQEQQLIDAAKKLADDFNAAYQAQVMQLQTPVAPVVTPKTQTKIINNTAKIQIKATPNTKADAQRLVAAQNKFYATNTGAKVAAGKFVF